MHLQDRLLKAHFLAPKRSPKDSNLFYLWQPAELQPVLELEILLEQALGFWLESEGVLESRSAMVSDSASGE